MKTFLSIILLATLAITGCMSPVNPQTATTQEILKQQTEVQRWKASLEFWTAQASFWKNLLESQPASPDRSKWIIALSTAEYFTKYFADLIDKTYSFPTTQVVR
jgi:hypothetical protein